MLIKKILLATDLSERSQRALARARQLADQHRAGLEVLYVIDESLPARLADRLGDDAERWIRNHLAPYPEASTSSFNVTVTRDHPYAGILKHAQQGGADLIVLGQHRETPFRDLFVGSTAWRVLCGADRPVLVVKNQAAEPYRRLLAALDLSEGSQRSIELACGISPGAEVTAIHAYHVPFSGFLRTAQSVAEISGEHRQAMATLVRDTLEIGAKLMVGVPAIRQNIREGEPVEVVLRERERVRADLLIVGTRGRAAVARAILGSTAEALLRLAPCDVLAVRTG